MTGEEPIDGVGLDIDTSDPNMDVPREDGWLIHLEHKRTKPGEHLDLDAKPARERLNRSPGHATGTRGREEAP